MSRQPEQPLVGEVRLRLPLPLVIPLAAVVVIAVFTIGISRVLLSLEPEAAVIVAIAVAANLLGACAFIALRPQVSGSAYMELLAIVLYPVLIGIVIASVGIGEEEATAGAHDGGAPAGGGLSIAAQNIAFDTSELEVSAGEETTLRFENNDSGIDHNVAVYESQDDAVSNTDPLFQGEIFPGVDSKNYDVPALDAGEYYFHCDVHPNMNGTVIVE